MPMRPRPTLLTLLALATLAGCSVRQAETKPKAETLPSPKTKMFALDESKVFLAERSSDLPNFDKLLAAAGKFHSYHEWNKEFLDDTMTQIKGLKKGEALDQSFYTESDRGLEEVRIKLIKEDPTHAILRMTCSNPDIVAEMQSDLNAVDLPVDPHPAQQDSIPPAESAQQHSDTKTVQGN